MFKVIEKIEKAWSEFQEKQKIRVMEREVIELVEKAFHTAQMFLEMKNEHLKTYVYPSILNVRFFDTHVEVFGRIPKGMNPQIFHQKEYIFQQYLHENIKIHTSVSKFTISIFPDRMDIVNYDYDSFPIQNMKMPVVAGKNRFNEWVTFSLIENPNVLIAGVPGSGKSVMDRQILTTLMLHHKPSELEIHLVDLKGSEFHIFQKCEHVKSMSVTSREFSPIMKKLRKELERRGRVLRENGVAHIDKLPKSKRMNYILLMIDEILLLNNGASEAKETRELLLEWAALGRALGCFTVISLQRPCHKSLDTTLRGILNVRIVFKTEDKTNSEIAGVEGAENISREEAGRMIFKIDKNDMQDIQAPFLDVEPSRKLVKPFIKETVIEEEVTEDNKVFGLLE
ncbi:FtsK/SpoIIIE domain-containing protein [Bacillus pseudomycoides]|uniref:FtsK/SpoIIIE domain-containing protein n=1 Tax=Bacillus pseudomycoides TaxID=64104 RepID=UPI000BF224CF|nr:FtsK/SpoIIIE domain-containing protein [Bacillus pseudomycoides]PEK34094.1 chromosome partitioning protein ParA [Bacillus pseudomycoides]